MEISLITLVTIVAGAVGTLTGFGTSTIMVPVLLLFLPLSQTLLLVGVIHFFGNIWKILLFKKGLNWKLIFTFGAAGIVLSYLGSSLVFAAPEVLLSRILGGFFLAYVIFLFLEPNFRIKGSTLTALAGGGLSGFFAGIFGVGGAVRGAFLSAFDLPKAVYISTAGAIALFIDATRITNYILNEVTLENRLIWGFVLFIPASFAGAAAAKKIVDRIPQNKFRIVIAVFLLLAGLRLLIFPR
ncbi:MAG: sulfite exporter TauE/SafE family protein [Chitinispirillaceae bacterium]